MEETTANMSLGNRPLMKRLFLNAYEITYLSTVDATGNLCLLSTLLSIDPVVGFKTLPGKRPP